MFWFWWYLYCEHWLSWLVVLRGGGGCIGGRGWWEACGCCSRHLRSIKPKVILTAVQVWAACPHYWLLSSVIGSLIVKIEGVLSWMRNIDCVYECVAMVVKDRESEREGGGVCMTCQVLGQLLSAKLHILRFSNIFSVSDEDERDYWNRNK